MKRYSRSIVWFRRDLRVSDHRALFEATTQSSEVLPIFIIDENIVHLLDQDDRRVTFIQKCIDELDQKFQEWDSRLLVLHGKPLEVLPKLVQELKVEAVFFNHDYEPYAKTRDEKMAVELKKLGVQAHSFKDQVIFERREILNGSGEPYRVFTPYSRNWIKALEQNKALHLKEYTPLLKNLIQATLVKKKSARFSEFGFKEVSLWIEPGEKAANKALKKFTARISDYKKNRDYPNIDGTSILSPHFRFGTLSIREAVRFCSEHFSEGAKTWLNELIWREFYQMILDQNPHVVKVAFRPEYNELKWEGKPAHFKAWCEGKTGYPLVDAAMRQLNETGWMHNRLRMITAMFLTKDLLIDWREGEKYFAKMLLDFDLASNNGGWQWSASTGCDAQPYFRVMNPVSQSEKFDPKGDFIRKFVPELKVLDSKRIHWPHEDGLFGSSLNGYQEPLVDHSIQREKAIRMFKK